MSEQTLPERMRKIALDLPVPDDMTNREYWLRTEILEWADALEAKLSKMGRALREIEAIDDPDDMGWIQAYVDWAFGRPYDKRLDRPDAWMKGNRPEALAGGDNE